MSDADRKRLLQSERTKRQRARYRNGEIMVRCVVGHDDISFLIAHGWLGEKESEDRAEIAAALMAAVRSARDP